ncbi:MAG: hypothetical protein OEU26_01040 [Candidatus Tectomicrobia bacterium]|nr:hypothetical protein [Candidatus Tectomicrobia bacterium]
MVLPIVTPAPVVVSHGDAFRDLFDNQREFPPAFQLCLPDALARRHP